MCLSTCHSKGSNFNVKGDLPYWLLVEMFIKRTASEVVGTGRSRNCIQQHDWSMKQGATPKCGPVLDAIAAQPAPVLPSKNCLRQYDEAIRAGFFGAAIVERDHRQFACSSTPGPTLWIRLHHVKPEKSVVKDLYFV